MPYDAEPAAHVIVIRILRGRKILTPSGRRFRRLRRCRGFDSEIAWEQIPHPFGAAYRGPNCYRSLSGIPSRSGNSLKIS